MRKRVDRSVLKMSLYFISPDSHPPGYDHISFNLGEGTPRCDRMAARIPRSLSSLGLLDVWRRKGKLNIEREFFNYHSAPRQEIKCGRLAGIFDDNFDPWGVRYRFTASMADLERCYDEEVGRLRAAFVAEVAALYQGEAA
jgi:hypothetical protein